MTTHDLKTWPFYFQAIWCGAKNFELRRDDRPYAAGDMLILREFDPATKSFTGRRVQAEVTYVLRDAEAFGLAPGHAALSLAWPSKYSTADQLRQDNN